MIKSMPKGIKIALTLIEPVERERERKRENEEKDWPTMPATTSTPKAD